MDRSETIMKLAEALSKAQGMIKGAVRDSTNPYFHATYADLASVWEACRIPLTTNGLSIIQTTDIIEGKMILITTLLHNSGEYVSGRYPIIPMRQKKDEGWSPAEDPQGLGSAITYARRYAMSAIIGIAPEDDDGETAMGRGKEEKKTIQKPKSKQSLQQGTQAKVLPEEPMPLLNFEDAMKRMEEIKNIYELKNWWSKHSKEISVMPENEKAEIMAYKDHLKYQFENPEKAGE